MMRRRSLLGGCSGFLLLLFLLIIILSLGPGGRVRGQSEAEAPAPAEAPKAEAEEARGSGEQGFRGLEFKISKAEQKAHWQELFEGFAGEEAGVEGGARKTGEGQKRRLESCLENCPAASEDKKLRFDLCRARKCLEDEYWQVCFTTASSTNTWSTAWDSPGALEGPDWPPSPKKIEQNPSEYRWPELTRPNRVPGRAGGQRRGANGTDLVLLGESQVKTKQQLIQDQKYRVGKYTHPHCPGGAESGGARCDLVGTEKCPNQDDVCVSFLKQGQGRTLSCLERKYAAVYFAPKTGGCLGRYKENGYAECMYCSEKLLCTPGSEETVVTAAAAPGLVQTSSPLRRLAWLASLAASSGFGLRW